MKVSERTFDVLREVIGVDVMTRSLLARVAYPGVAYAVRSGALGNGDWYLLTRKRALALIGRIEAESEVSPSISDLHQALSMYREAGIDFNSSPERS